MTERDSYHAAVKAVLDIHRKQERPVLVTNKHGTHEEYVCEHCACPNDRWPCPTWRAVMNVLTGGLPG